MRSCVARKVTAAVGAQNSQPRKPLSTPLSTMPSQNPDPERNEKIEAYFSCLDKAFAKEVDWPRAIELRKELLPKSLFKYQRFDKNQTVEPGHRNEDYCLQNLRNHQLRLTAPLDFNDPYDTASFFLIDQAVESVPYDLEAFLSMPEVRDHMPEETKELLRSSDGRPNTVQDILLKQIPDDLSREFTLRFREKIFDQFGKEMVHSSNQFFRKNIRVSSFCEINDSIVMWSHYGGYHKGFCLEYDSARLALDVNILGWLHPVRYNTNLSNVTKYLKASIQYRISGGQIANIWAPIVACHKSPEWSYEREWRVVALDERDFFQVEPVSVILGARIDDLPDQKTALLAIANDSKIPIKQAVIRDDRFELEVVDYQSINHSKRRL
jgi:hypothetical protein